MHPDAVHIPSPFMPIDISVIVPTYRRPERLQRLVDALGRQTMDLDRWELIVVDDCSGPKYDPFYTALATSFPGKLRIEHTPRNGGPDPARNVGISVAEAPEYLAFLDDDLVPDPHWLEAAFTALESNERAGVIQGHTAVPDGVDTSTLPFLTLWREITGPSPFFEGCNIFYRRAALEAVGGFTVDLDMYGNDSATGWAVLEAGWERAFSDDARVVHDLERRSLRWWIKNGLVERKMVTTAARHPGYRAEAFWRPWAIRKRDALFAIAVGSGIAGLVWKPAVLGVLPYIYLGRPSLDRPGALRVWGDVFVLDLARFVGHVRGTVESRTLVL